MAEERKHLYYVSYSYENPSLVMPRTLYAYTFHNKPLETEDDIHNLMEELTSPYRVNVVLLPWVRID